MQERTCARKEVKQIRYKAGRDFPLVLASILDGNIVELPDLQTLL